MPAAGVNFLGEGNTNSPSIITGTPPDPAGAVGPNDYVEAVNGGIEVFNKTGTVAKAAVSTRSLWAGYVGTNAGNGCATRNDGDAIVRYDQLADRWMISQFSLPNSSSASGPSFQCVAVSKTGDPTGAYWLYDFKYSAAVNDYPKIGIWPDAYYATYNLFGTNAFAGVEVCAWDRSKMLAGIVSTQQCFLLPYTAATYFSLLPASVDGAVAPPQGSPEYLAAYDENTLNALQVWKFHVDWATPANSTLTGPTAVPVTAFTDKCAATATGQCIPQPGGQTLESAGDRLMDRLSYRNFGTYESLVVDHSIAAGSTEGVRWYELRLPSEVPTLYQEGTYSPNDGNWRWMGSIAQDQAGDMALGFSVSSATLNPEIAWAGRLATDPLGTMGQGEAVIAAGSQHETGAGRWGDYTSMTVDPTDDCTFWYVNELYGVAGTFTWDTQIASVKFPSCGANDFSLSGDDVSVVGGASGTTTIHTTLTKGTSEPLALAMNDLPAGVTASFSPTSVTAGSTSTLTLNVPASVPAGAFPIRVIAKGASAYRSASFTLTVLPHHTLTVAKLGTGGGTVGSSPAGISCGSTCAAEFAEGATVTLTPTADASSIFGGWSGACAGSGSCTVTMDAAKSVGAIFVATPPPPPPPPPPPVLCVVPQVKGTTIATAQAALLAVHCKLGTVGRAYSRTVAKGKIVSQSVAPATTLANGSAVGVVVSRGRKPVPKVTLCYRRHTIRVTKARAKILRRHGAKLGACKKR